AKEHRPDVVLMDIRMPGGDGIHATQDITADPVLAGTRVLVLSMFEVDEYVYGALRAGASGFLLKDGDPAQLIDAVRRVQTGEALFALRILTRLIEHYVERTSRNAAAVGSAGSVGLEDLTPRETEVLTLVGRGLANDEIAGELSLSAHTVKTYIGNLLAKLHARDRAQLVIAAYETRLVTPREP
ncbi:response regulator transcription factor, partial [Leucobacter sp. M11]|uniref:response regulator transcription factor n=1 Tax=Leucobacter sp. M11 TaxID=2993565 RepID=UPI002D7FCE09